jgi:hypothetical protein
MAFLNFGQGQGMLPGGQPQAAMPRVPWGQNPLVTMAGLGLLGGRNLNEGLQNVAQMAPAGLAAKTAQQRDMYSMQQQATQSTAQKAAWNAGMKWRSGIALTQADQDALASAPEIAAKFMPQSPELPTSVREYQYGLKDPGYLKNQMDLKNAGGINIDNVGSIPQGYQLVTDPKTGTKRMEVIPGGPAEVSERSADVVEQAGAEGQAVKAGTMLDATRSVKDEIKNATFPAVGTLSRPFALYSGSAAGRVRSYVSSLQSGVALQAILKLKEASSTGATGFGALSAPELNLLVTDIGSLDPDNTEPDIFLKTIDRIESRWKSVLQDVQRTVPPERLAEMGIDINALIGGTEAAAPTSGAPISAEDYFNQ